MAQLKDLIVAGAAKFNGNVIFSNIPKYNSTELALNKNIQIEAGQGLTTSEAGDIINLNESGKQKVTISHGPLNHQDVSNKQTSDMKTTRTYINDIDVDSFGHVLAIYVHDEEEASDDSYKSKQSAVDTSTVYSSGVSSTFISDITQNSDGVISVVKKNISVAQTAEKTRGTLTINNKASFDGSTNIDVNITAADLGLSSALRFVGIVSQGETLYLEDNRIDIGKRTILNTYIEDNNKIKPNSVKIEYCIYEDGKNYHENKGWVIGAYNYLANNDGDVTPALFKEDSYGIDYLEPFYYYQTAKGPDNKTYEWWRKIELGENGDYSWTGPGAYILTNVITSGETRITASLGDVIIYNSLEYVWTGDHWEELGDEGSYILKGTTITTSTGLEGGGSLEDGLTLSIKDGGVDTDQIANGAVTADKLSDDIDFGVASVTLSQDLDTYGSYKLTVNGTAQQGVQISGLDPTGNRNKDTLVTAAAGGQINSVKYAITAPSSNTVKATYSYNTSNDCIELQFT